MKVGIITFHNVNNYGSVLQTYATQETFRRLGCETEVIDYCREDQKFTLIFERISAGVFRLPEVLLRTAIMPQILTGK